jgi:hypothetical protein
MVQYWPAGTRLGSPRKLEMMLILEVFLPRRLELGAERYEFGVAGMQFRGEVNRVPAEDGLLLSNRLYVIESTT